MTPEAKKLLAQILYELERDIADLSSRINIAGIDYWPGSDVYRKIDELGKIFDAETKETENDQPDS